MRRPMPRRMFRQSVLITATIGDLTISPCSLTSSNTGDSGTLARMIRPTMTRTMLARNGSRHAQSPSQVHADQEHQVGQQQANREARLHHARVAALFLPRRVLVAHQDRPTPLGAERDALDDAHRRPAGSGRAGRPRRRWAAGRSRRWPAPSRSARRPAPACVPPCRPGDRRGCRRAAGRRIRHQGWRTPPACRPPGWHPGRRRVPKYRAAAVPNPMKS